MLSIIFIIIGILCLISVCTVMIYIYKRFALAKDIPYFPVTKTKNHYLTIGIVGDSWATFNKLDAILHQELLENGFKNKIISGGQSGAKTRLIYQNLFKDASKKNSCKFIIESMPDYCIVLAGTNDAIGQMGGNYYAYHIIKVINALLNYGIRPVVITLPKVGIKETHNNMNIFQRYRNLLSASFNNKGKIENIESYRGKLIEKLDIAGLKDSILLVDFDKVCDSFKAGSDLYKNPLHLSARGNKKLAHFIAKELIKILKEHPIQFDLQNNSKRN